MLSPAFPRPAALLAPLLLPLMIFISGCTSSDSTAIDSLLGHFSSTPILTSVSDQIVSQEDALTIDVNNIKDGQPGTDKDMSYDCTYDTIVDKKVDSGLPCTSLPSSTVTFEKGSGILKWTPHVGILGNYELRVRGTNKEGYVDQIFTIGVRLKFDGLGQITAITGNSATANWTPNSSAQGYQIFRLNNSTGQYEMFRQISGGSQSGAVITGLAPNTPYTLRVQAVDGLGNLDGNVVSRSFTTTELVKFSMNPSTATVAAGTPQLITVQAYNANGTLQTTGGLPLTPQISSGTSSGNFSSVNDNNDGTYSFTFTPTTVGSAIDIDITTNMTFFLQNVTALNVIPGPPHSANSSLIASSTTVVSGNSVNLVATIRDAYNNPLPTSAVVSFAATGGTSTGNISTVTAQGNGVYTATYTGLRSGSSQTIKVLVDGATLTPSAAVQVLAGAPVSGNSTVTVGASTIASGTSTTVTATLRDVNNNPVTSGILVAFNKSGGTSTGALGSVVNAGNGVYTTTYSGINAGTAQVLTVSVDGVGLVPSATVQVVPGPALLANSSLTISNPTVLSGQFVTVAATLKDVNNNPIESGVTVSFAKTGGTSTGSFGAVVNQGGGVYNIRYTGLAAGTAQNIKVLVNGVDLGFNVTIQVVPAAASAVRSSLALSAPSVVSGQSVTITATIKDANDNPISSGVLIGFTKTGGTSTGTFSGITNAGNGVYTLTYTGLASGSAQTIGVQVDGSDLGPTQTVTVLSGAVNLANSSLTISNGTVLSGQNVTLTATLRDVNNNPIAAASAVTFDKSGGTSTGTLSSVVNQGGGVYTVNYAGLKAGTPQTIKVLVNGADTTFSTTVQVVPAAPSVAQSSLTITSNNVVSGNTVTITATLKDLNQNPISSGVLVALDVTGGTSTGNTSAITNAGNGVYTMTYTGVTAGSAQTISLMTDGNPLGLFTTVTVLSGSPLLANSSITVSNANVISGQSVTVTATLRDVNNNPVDPTSTITFSKAGGTSTGNFSSVINQGGGVYTISYTGVLAGTAQTVKVLINGADLGPSVSITVNPGSPSAAQSSIAASSASITSGTSSTITATIKDANGNPISSGLLVSFTKSGGTSTGNFSSVTNAGSGVYTITYSGVTAGSAQTIGVSTDGTALGPTTPVAVVPGAFDLARSSLSITNSVVASGSLVTVSASLRDSNNNAIDPASTVAFSAVGGTSAGTLGTLNNSGATYSVTYTGVTAGTAQALHVTINGVDLGTTVSVQVVPGAPSSVTSTLTIASATVVSGASDLITATIKDANGNPITTGVTIAFTKSGGSSTGTFSSVTNAGSGIYTVTYTGVTSGTAQTIGVTADATPLSPTVTVQVIPGGVYLANSSLAISNTSVTSGSMVTATATLRDVNNNPIDPASTVAFSKSGGTSTGNFGTMNSVGGGVYTIAYTGVTAGTAQTIKVSINTVDLGPSVSITVNPGAPSAANSSITVASSTVLSGATDLVTATIKDANNNPISSGILVAFSKFGGTSTGTFTSVVNAGNGVYTVNYQGVVAGSAQTLAFSTDGNTLGPTTTVTVLPGAPAAAQSSLALTSNSVVAGNSVTLTATIRDANSNPISSGILVQFDRNGGTSYGNLSTVTNQGNGVYTAVYSAITAGSAQTIQANVNGAGFGPTQTLQVLVGAPDAAHSSLTITSSPVASGATAVISALIRDSQDNPINTQYAITFDVSGGTSTGTLGSLANSGTGTFTMNYTGVTAGTAQTVRVLSGGTPITGLSASLQVVPGAVALANSSLTVSSASLTSGNFVTVTATLRDVNNNPIDPTSTVAFSKSGGTSTGNFGTMNSVGNGVYTISYTGITAGTAQTIKVSINSVDLGPSVSITVNPGAPYAANSSITVASSTVLSGATDLVTATIKDANNNPISSGILVAFSKFGGTSTGNYSSVTNQGNGIYQVNYQGVTAGSAQTLAFSVDGNTLGPTTTVTVLPGAPSNALSTLTVTSNSVTAGSSVTFTATIKDANSNPIASGIVVAFDKVGGTSTGNFGTVVNQGAGIYTVTYTGITAGTAQTVQANVNAAGFGPTQSIQVLVGAPALANSSLTLSASTVASGAAVTITAVVRDSQNNPITNQYAITFDAIGGTSTGSISAINNSGTGTFTASYTGVNAGTAQTVRVLADGGPISGLTRTLSVTPGAPLAANSTFSISNSTVQSGASSTLNMNLRDANNNPISSGATITFTKSTGGSDGTISAVNNAGSGNYNATYTGVTQGATQTIALVVNGTAVGLSVTATVTAGPPTQMTIVGPNNPLASIDCNGPYVVTLKDASGNTTSSLSSFTMSMTANPVGSITGTVYTDGTCTTTTTSLSFGASVQAQSFYYKAYIPQNFTLQLNPSLGSIAVNTTTITNLPVLALVGGGAYFTMNGSGSNLVADDTAGGSYTPYDIAISGNFMYAVDNTAHRIMKYNISTNAFVGWLGHFGSTEDAVAYDGTVPCPTACTLATITNNDMTSKWTVGGRSNSITAGVINAPRNIAADSTYIYVASQSRILRFLQSDGSYQGWYGRVSTTLPTSPTACTSGGGQATNTTTATWCFGGTHTTGTADGQFNTVAGLAVAGNYLYVSDYSNQRIQRIDISTATPVAKGWIGQAATQPPSSGQLATCGTQPTTGNPTPGWCLGGTAQVANRYNVAGPSPGPEVAAPNEGFYNPRGLTTDGSYLYVADGNNFRIVRIDLTAGGSFAGWVGNVQRSSVLSPTSPTQTSGTYTNTWTSGGVVNASASTTGFGTINNMVLDTSTSPNYLYVTDTSYHRVVRIRTSDGGDFRWIGRNNGSPSGGYTGCSSSPVGGTNPGWCTGGSANRVGNGNGTFYNVAGIAFSGNTLYVADSSNFRIQAFDKTYGTFNNWIGAGNSASKTWSRTYNAGTIASRAGIDDYSSLDWSGGGWYQGITHNGTSLFQTDAGSNRIKRFNLLDGSVVGYVGQIGTFAPTGPDACIGFTSGMTPSWCTGGGRTGSGAGIHGYNAPFSIAADSNYVYVGDYNNNRVDRVRISDGLYMGWVGWIGTTPTDGDSGCTSSSGVTTPGWCIGGAASGNSTLGGFSALRAIFYDSALTMLFVSDNSGRIIKVRPSDGAVQGITGAVSTGSGGCSVSGNAASAYCTSVATGSGSNNYGSSNNISGLATDANYIYTTDTATHRVNRWEKATGAPAGFIGNVNALTALDTTNATFTVNSKTTTNGCQGLAAGGFPKAAPGWCIATSVGASINAAVAGTGNGQFNSPRGVWSDGTNLYVADFGNNRIVKIDAATGNFIGWRGFITSTTGMTDSDCIAAGAGGVTPKWCAGGTSGPGKSLGAFDAPGGIFGDSNYVYVHDGRNNRNVTVPK